MGESLHAAGMTVAIPRLPGHGTDGGDFLRTGWRDWLRACTDALMELRAEHAPVSIVGFSMGGLLALILASRFPVQRLVLLAPPILTRDPRLPFTPLLGLFISRRRRRIDEPLPGDPEEATLVREYRGFRYPRQIAGILALRRLARRGLHRVSADTLTITAREDPYVPASVIAAIESRLAAARTRHLVVEGGHRSLLEGDAKGQIRTEVAGWLTV